MKNRLNVARAATFTLLSSGLLAPARAGEGLPPEPQVGRFEFCSSGPGASGCVRFQGYIYVGRAPSGDAAPIGGVSAPSSSLGDGRLHIHEEGADAR